MDDKTGKLNEIRAYMESGTADQQAVEHLKWCVEQIETYRARNRAFAEKILGVARKAKIESRFSDETAIGYLNEKGQY